MKIKSKATTDAGTCETGIALHFQATYSPSRLFDFWRVANDLLLLLCPLVSFSHRSLILYFCGELRCNTFDTNVCVYLLIYPSGITEWETLLPPFNLFSYGSVCCADADRLELVPLPYLPLQNLFCPQPALPLLPVSMFRKNKEAHIHNSFMMKVIVPILCGMLAIFYLLSIAIQYQLKHYFATFGFWNINNLMQFKSS